MIQNRIYRYIVFCGFILAPIGLQAHPLLVEHLNNAGFRSLEIDFTRTTMPSSKSEADLEKYYRLQYDEHLSENKIDPESASGATTARQFRELLDAAKAAEIAGSKTVYKCILTLGSDGVLMQYSENFRKDEESGVVLENPSWDFLTPTALFQYSQATEMITLHTVENTLRAHLGILLHDLGVFGKAELAKNIFATAEFPLVTDEQGRLSLKNNYLLLTAEPAKGVNALSGIKLAIRDQIETYSFNDYKHLDNPDIYFPTKIAYSFTNSQFAMGSDINLLTWQRDSGPSSVPPPITLPNFGFIRVFDYRFGPGVSYNAFQKLPSDEEALEFVNDSSKLEAYEKKLQENKN